jgi:hypothetical protein
MKSGVLFLFFSEIQARFANSLQNLFGLRSFWDVVLGVDLGCLVGDVFAGANGGVGILESAFVDLGPVLVQKQKCWISVH